MESLGSLCKKKIMATFRNGSNGGLAEEMVM